MKINSFDENIFVIHDLTDDHRTYLNDTLTKSLTHRKKSFTDQLKSRYTRDVADGGCIFSMFDCCDDGSIILEPVCDYNKKTSQDKHYILNLFFTHNYSHFLHQHCVLVYNLLLEDNVHVHYIANKHSTQDQFDTLYLFVPENKRKNLHIINDTSRSKIECTGRVVQMLQNCFSPAKFPNTHKIFLDHVHDNIIETVEQDLLIFVIRGVANERRSRNAYVQNDIISNMLQTYAKHNNLTYHEHYGSMTTEKQIKLFQRARIVVGFTGAGMANVAWMQRNSKSHVVEFGAILPEQRSAFGGPPGFGYSHLGFWGYNVSQHLNSWNILPYTKDSTPERITIDIDDLKQTIEQLEL